MSVPVRILHLDDNPLDAQLVAMTLEAEEKKFPTTLHYVQTKEAFLAALARKDFDIILSDYRMPGYDGDDALASAQDICPEIPFIMVTGELGEEFAVERLQRGASDYVLKDRIFRLVPAIKRALGEAENEKKRRDAERAQREGEERYRRLVENIHDALLVEDVQGRVVFANDRFLELYGLSREDLSSMTLEDYVAPEDREILRERHERRMRGEKVPTQFEYRGIRKDGTYVWLDASVVPLSQSGKIVGTQSTIRDITARKRTDEELRKAHRDTTEILESLQDPFISLDKDWRITYVNSKAEQFTHQAYGQLLGKNLWEEFPYLRGSSSEAPLRKAMVERVPADYETFSPLGPTWIEAHIFPRADGGLSILYRNISDRKAQEQALRKSEELFASAFRASPHPFVISRATDGMILDVNEAFLRLFGWAREEVLGRSSTSLGMFDNSADRERAIDQLLRDRRLTGFETRVRLRSGEVRLVVLSAESLELQGEPALLTIMQDVTEQRRAEEAFRKTELRLRVMFERAPLGIVEVNADDHFVAVNPRICQMLGYTREELLGMSVHDLTAPEDRRLSDQMNASLREPGREMFAYQKRYLKKDSTPLWVNVTVSALRDQEGSFSGAIGTIEDITERKRVEEEREQLLAEMRKRSVEYDALFSSMVVGIAVYNPQGKLLNMNPTARVMLGYPETDLELHTSQWVTKVRMETPDGRAIAPEEAPLSRALKGEVVRDFLFKFHRASGDTAWLVANASPIRMLDGTMLGAVSAFIDVTERARAEKALAESEERFRAAQDASLDGFTVHKPRYDELGEIVDFIFQYENAAAARSNGTRPGEVVGRGLLELFPGLRHTRFFEAFRQVAISKRPVELEEHYKGETVTEDTWFRVVVVPAGDKIAVLTQDVTSRRQAEEELRKAKERLEIILHDAADGFIIYDKDFRFSYIGDNTAERFRRRGRNPEELVGKVLWEEFPEFVGSEALTTMQGAMAQRVPLTFESKYQEHWFSTRCIPTSDAGLAVLSIDITERKQMEERLRESEGLSRLALSAGAAGAWSWDLRTDTVQWSDEFYRIFGLVPGSVDPHTEAGLSRIHPEDRDRVLSLIDKARTTGEALDIVHRVIWPDGSVHWVRGMAKAFFENAADSYPSRLVGLAIDVTEEKETEERLEQLNLDLHRRNFELEAERVKWHHLIEGIAEEVWSCDLEGRMSLVNLVPDPAMKLQEFTRKTIEEVTEEVDILNPNGTLRRPEDAPLLLALKGKVVRGEEIMQHRTTAITRHRQYSAAPVRDANGTIVGSVAIVQDVTDARQAELEAKQANLALQRLNQELEERVKQRTLALEKANQELEAFSYTVSHDLKAPLRAIDGFTRLLANPHHGLPPEKQGQYVKFILTSTEQMTKLIESLLAFARTQRQVPHKGRVDMHRLAEQVIQEQRRALGAEAERVQVTLGEMPREVSGDPVLLKQVFANLLSNAFKFTRKRQEPRIELGGYKRNGDLVYFVRDNGAGFPSSQVEKLFQVFQRLHGHGEFEGTGIGLATVRKIVERHGGQVCAEGEVGKGATFYFSLPAKF